MRVRRFLVGVEGLVVGIQQGDVETYARVQSQTSQVASVERRV